MKDCPCPRLPNGQSLDGFQTRHFPILRSSFAGAALSQRFPRANNGRRRKAATMANAAPSPLTHRPGSPSAQNLQTTMQTGSPLRPSAATKYADEVVGDVNKKAENDE